MSFLTWKNNYIFSQNRYRWVHVGCSSLYKTCPIDIAVVLFDRTKTIFKNLPKAKYLRDSFWKESQVRTSFKHINNWFPEQRWTDIIYLSVFSVHDNSKWFLLTHWWEMTFWNVSFCLPLDQEFVLSSVSVAEWMSQTTVLPWTLPF